VPQVSIGIPIYNEEQFIQFRLENILEQTHQDFEIIICDNASTDKTQSICETFAKSDKRIHYYRNNLNIGWFPNFKKVLFLAKSKYFVWAAGDDLWAKNFLEKNLQNLKTNPNSVCSMSTILLYDYDDNHTIQIQKTVKCFDKNFKLWPVLGNYDNKIRQILRNPSLTMYLYGVFLTEPLKESFSKINQKLSGDRTLVLSMCKFGDLMLMGEPLFFRYPKGTSLTSILYRYRSGSIGIFELFFPYGEYVYWCYKNLGPKIFFKNLDVFIIRLLSGFFAIGLAIFKKNNYIGKQKKL